MTLRSVTRSAWLPGMLLTLPLLVAFCVLARAVVNIPCMDDYDAVLRFLGVYGSLHGFGSRLGWVLTAQHNEYKLIFLHAVVAAEYGLTAHVNFIFLCWAGNLFIALTLAAAWLLFRRLPGSLAQRLWLFLPAALLLCALQYLETTDWAMAGLQNLTTVPFALLALLALDRRRAVFIGGCIALCLSICCSASGFFAALSGLCMLVIHRRWRRATVWAASSLGMALLYAVRYHAYTVAPPVAFGHALLYFAVTAVSFPGAALSNLWLSTFLGCTLIAVMAWLIRRGWLRADPAGFAIALFICITAVGVAHGRYRLGMASGTASRYRIYSLLLLVTLYAGVLRTVVPASCWTRQHWRRLWGAFTLLAVLFCAASDYAADWRLVQRRDLLIRHLILWERAPGALILVPDEQPVMHTAEWIAFRIRAQQAMAAALAAGEYKPPISATAPLPQIDHR